MMHKMHKDSEANMITHRDKDNTMFDFSLIDKHKNVSVLGCSFQSNKAPF